MLFRLAPQVISTEIALELTMTIETAAAIFPSQLLLSFIWRVVQCQLWLILCLFNSFKVSLNELALVLTFAHSTSLHDLNPPPF